MRKHKGAPEFTHFASIPFIRATYRQQLSEVQNKIIGVFKDKNLENTLKVNNPNLFHLTLSMLTIPHTSTKRKTQQVLQKNRQKLADIMKNTKLTSEKINYFTFKNNRNKNSSNQKNVSVIYLNVKKDNQFLKLSKLTDQIIRLFLKEEIIVDSQLKQMYIQYDHNTNMFKNRDPHITLFRCQNLLENQIFADCFQQIESLYQNKTLQCDYIDVSTRFDYDQAKFYTPLFRLHISQDKIGSFFSLQLQQQNNSKSKEKKIKYIQKKSQIKKQ